MLLPRSDGFMGPEYLGPYAELKEKVADAFEGQRPDTQCSSTCHRAIGPAASAVSPASPDRVQEFRDGVAAALDYAAALGCKRLNVISGLVPEGANPETLERVLVDNLRYAAPRMADAGIKLLIEPINLHDMPGFLLSTTDHAERILEKVGSDNLYIQYDFYHMQITQGDLDPDLRTIEGSHRPCADRRQSGPQ